MAQEFRVFNCQFAPASITPGQQSFPLAMPDRIVEAVEFMIPAGNKGAVSFALAMGGNQIIPYNPGSTITGDDEVIHWPLDGFPDTGAWTLIGVNVGAFYHTIQVRFLLNMPRQASTTALQPLVL